MTPQNIRNFCIISHIDHGKSTLADRLLELTGAVEKRKMKAQYLDAMDLEREKGITIKLQPVRMECSCHCEEVASGDRRSNLAANHGIAALACGLARNDKYILNLIDTPGHVDFSYEVSRSLAAVEGALLLVDASQGVQAQTLANLHLALGQNLTIIPVINKIDLEQARVDETEQEICELLNTTPKEIIKISAKEGTNIEEVLDAIVERIPPPSPRLRRTGPPAPLRALIFDSKYDSYKGAIAYVRIVDGEIKAGDRIELLASKTRTEAIEVGVFKPQTAKTDSLNAGEIGYIATGLRNLEKCRVGDTIAAFATAEPLTGYAEPKSVVFASLYPADAADYDSLKDGLSKLKLNDAALQYEPESCEGLGRGFRCGFLGMLHMEIVLERLKREYHLELVVTSPSVDYIITAEQSKEPWVKLEIITPSRFVGAVMSLLKDMRSQYKDTKYLSAQRAVLKYEAPLNEIITNFYNQLKNISAGYASMSYELIEHRPADLVKMDILVAGEKIRAFSRIVHRSKAEEEGRALVKKLKKIIPPQLFAVALQAVIGGKIIARETISAYRKDVTGYLYGGDYSRKRKLLEKQKKGKKKMKARGRIHLPQDVFLKVLKK